MSCLVCRGRGRIDIWIDDKNGLPEFTKIMCYACEGKKKEPNQKKINHKEHAGAAAKIKEEQDEDREQLKIF